MHLLQVTRPAVAAVVATLTALILAAAALLRAAAADEHKRGAEVLKGRAARRAAWRRASRYAGAVRLAGVAVEPREETRHFKLIGTTGTGKSTAIAGLLATALARGDRAIITDPDAGYAARFYQPRRGDLILNPFDARSVKWDPFAEVLQPWDVEQLASGLIPASEDAAAREWRGYARTFLAAVMRRCCECGRTDSRELWRLLTVAPSAELRPLIAGTPAQPFLEPENARMFGSIRSVAASAAAAFEYVQAQRARSFSVRAVCPRRPWGALHALRRRAGPRAALDHRDLDAHRDLRGDEPCRRGPAAVVHRRRTGLSGRHRRAEGRAGAVAQVRRPLRPRLSSRLRKSPPRTAAARHKQSWKTAATP